MTFQVSIYGLVFLIASFLSAVAAWLAWKKRQAPGAIYLFFMMLAVVEWNLTNFMENSSLQLEQKILWAKLMYLGAQTSPEFLLLFSLTYTGRKRWLTKRNIILLFSIPVTTILLAATNEWHHLIWTGFIPGSPGSNSYIYLHGPWFWFNSVYINSILMLSSWFILLFATRSKDIFAHQVIALISAIAVSWLSFVVYLSPWNPFPGLDLISIALAITGCILVFTILQLHFLDIIPVAREMLIEEMADGIIVLDEKDRIIDINKAAISGLGIKNGRWIGYRIDSVPMDFPNLSEYIGIKSNLDKIITIQSPKIRHIDLRVSLLKRDNNKILGRLFVLRDVTKLIQTSDALTQANQQLRSKLLEIEKLQAQLYEQSIRDQLTGLFNRRFLADTMPKELWRAQREGYSVGVMIIDIDQFKQINDTHGHHAGDQVLKMIGQFLRAKIRQSDIVYRYGGEEFLVALPKIKLEELKKRAENLRQDFENKSAKYNDIELSTTLSIGIAIYPQDANTLQEIIRAADTAMYAAKRAGRNRVCIYEKET